MGELAQTLRRQDNERRRCAYGSWLETLDDEDRAELEKKAGDRYVLGTAWVSRWAIQHGVNLSTYPIQEHRHGACRCRG